MNKFLHKQETFDIIGACMAVHSELGNGFLEPAYQEALEIALADEGIPFEREKQLKIAFRGRELKKKYFADFVCFDKVIVELKALSELTGEHEAQLLNYLKATGMKVGLLVNFGAKSLQHKRMVLSK